MNLLLSAPCPRLAGGIEAARVGTANTQRTAAPGNRYRTSRAVHQGGCYLASAGPTLVSAARFLTLGRDVSRWGPRYGAGVLFQIYFQGPNCCGTRRDRRDSSGPFAALRRRCALQHGAEIGRLDGGVPLPWYRHVRSSISKPMVPPHVHAAACSSRAASRTRESGPLAWRWVRSPPQEHEPASRLSSSTSSQAAV